jgi:polysaccharide biosynthesis transport protein
MTLVDVGARSSRRRAVVFCCAFLLAAAASLTWVYTRPAEYRAVARLHISPALIVTQPIEAKDTPAMATDAKSFLTEVQVLTSRPLLEDVIKRLKSANVLPDLGPDPVASAQGMLRAEPVEGTQLVQLSAEGRQQDFLPRLANAVAEAYQQHVTAAYRDIASSAYAEVNDEARTLDTQVAAKREAINVFRKRYDIVSMEHNENDVLANIEGLSQSYTDANEHLAKAKGRLQALKISSSAGNVGARAKDDPTIADLEQRVSALREQWGELERRFTPDFLSLDPDAKSLRARLENLEGQLASQRAASGRTALADAQQELSAAQAEVDRLRQDVADNQRQAQEFATHLNDYKALREDLDHLEGMHRAALDRLEKLQASERERAPRAELLEAAAPSGEPWRPDYRQDAAISLAGSFAFGLFAAWFADFIVGPSPLPTAFVEHSWSPALLVRESAGPMRELSTSNIGQLPAPTAPPRELADAEITALIVAATDDARLAMTALLTGMRAEELAALRWDDIDLKARLIHVGGESHRTIPLQEPFGSLIDTRQTTTQTAATVLHDARGHPLAIEEVERLVLYGAYDAGLDRPHEVTANTLRYTYLSFLLRQGIRAADISRIVGGVPQNELLVYMQLHSPTARLPFEQIQRLLPVLRELDMDTIVRNA